MVEIFKTNVENKKQAIEIIVLLNSKFPKLQVNFDLEDCDRILRVEGSAIHVEKVAEWVHWKGYQCELLDNIAVDSENLFK
jgi:hypothetical protein